MADPILLGDFDRARQELLAALRALAKHDPDTADAELEATEHAMRQILALERSHAG